MSILDRIQDQLGINLFVFDWFDEIQIQDVLAPILRKKALDHLLRSSDPRAQNFRVTFLQEHPGKSMRDYFTTMRQSGQWGTEDEAKALAEMLDFNLNTTYIEEVLNQNRSEEDIREEKNFTVMKNVELELYKTNTPDAPTINLKNLNNQHWFVNDKTESQGDCLFDAIAQALQQLVKPELGREHINTSPISVVTDHERIKNVDNMQLEELKTKIGSEVISTLIENMQQTSLSEFEAVKLISEDLIKAIGTEMPNIIDDKFKILLQTAESISDMNTILDDMRMSLKKHSLTMLGMLKEDGIVSRTADSKMLKQQIMKASSLCSADKILSDLSQRYSNPIPDPDTPREDDIDDIKPSGGRFN